MKGPHTSEIQESRNRQRDRVVEAYINLVTAVLARGIKDKGLEYLKTEDGRWWLDVAGVDSGETLGYVERISKRAG